MTNVLIIFIKNPRLGKVKTRLARTVGDSEALRIYQLLLEQTRQTALGLSVHRRLYYDAYIDVDDAWLSVDFEKHLQTGADLGARMEHAFASVFAQVPDARVGIIGSDCPELPAATLQKAFDMLETHDAVIGPSTDGGYYFLGLRSFDASVFRGISWSTDAVLRQTLEVFEQQGKTCVLLEPRTDIDTAEDWQAYLVAIKEGRM